MFFSGDALGTSRAWSPGGFVDYRLLMHAVCMLSQKTSHRPLESDLCQVRKNPKVHAGAPLFSICENLHTKLLGGGGPERKQRFVFRKLVLAAKAERKAYCKVSESLKSPLVRYDS